jgi:hypothetical protein
MAGTATAQVSENKTESGDVTVDVSSTIAVDVQPANLNYPNAEPGVRNQTSARGFGAIEVHNTGSLAIDNMWLNASTPNQDPFGQGDSTIHDAGNFLQVQPGDDLQGDQDDYHFINRKEYSWSNTDRGVAGTTYDTDVPAFIQLPDSNGWSNADVGSFRRGNESIYYAINTNSGSCNGGSATMRVGNVSSTDDRLGTVDFTDSTEYGWIEYTTSDLTSSAYGITSGPASGEPSMVTGESGVALNWTNSAADDKPLYDVLTTCSGDQGQPHTVRTRYNINALESNDLTSDGQQAESLINPDNSNPMQPGEMKTINTAIEVPEGTAAGSIGDGVLRVYVTAFE